MWCILRELVTWWRSTRPLFGNTEWPHPVGSFCTPSNHHLQIKGAHSVIQATHVMRHTWFPSQALGFFKAVLCDVRSFRSTQRVKCIYGKFGLLQLLLDYLIQGKRVTWQVKIHAFENNFGCFRCPSFCLQQIRETMVQFLRLRIESKMNSLV